MAEIHAHYTWTADLCVAAYRVALRNSLQHKIRIAIIVVLIVLGVLIAVEPSTGGIRGMPCCRATGLLYHRAECLTHRWGWPR